MAWQAKFTAPRGQAELKDVVTAAGSAEAQSDTISINMDINAMGKAEALQLIDRIRNKIHAMPWPPL